MATTNLNTSRFISNSSTSYLELPIGELDADVLDVEDDILLGTATGSIAGSQMTSVSTPSSNGVSVNTWIDSLNTPTADNTSQKYGAVIRSRSDSDEFSDGGIIAAVKYTYVNGEGGAYYTYADRAEAYNNNSQSNIDFITAYSGKSTNKGTADYLRGTVIDTINEGTANFAQGGHFSIVAKSGSTTGEASVVYLDFDPEGGVVSNQFAYLEIGNDGEIATTAGDSSYAILSNSPLKSKFEGSVQIGESTVLENSNNAGALRYVSSANRSAVEMLMQTGASTYSWVVVKENTW